MRLWSLTGHRVGGWTEPLPSGGRTMMLALERRTGIWRLSLEQIEATVADHLGHGRVPGNQAARCLSREVSMYLAKNVGMEHDQDLTIPQRSPQGVSSRITSTGARLCLWSNEAALDANRFRTMARFKQNSLVAV